MDTVSVDSFIQINLSDLARSGKNAAVSTIFCSNLLCVFLILKVLPYSSVITYMLKVRHTLKWFWLVSIPDVYSSFWNDQAQREDSCERRYVPFPISWDRQSCKGSLLAFCCFVCVPWNCCTEKMFWIQCISWSHFATKGRSKWYYQWIIWCIAVM